MIFSDPLQSLQAGRWFKLICGASFQDLPAIRHLVLAYALAGADCIDVAAIHRVDGSPSGLDAAAALIDQAREKGFGGLGAPWLMISVNDGTDPHFRKVAFDPAHCPADCPRPCVSICPAEAIRFYPSSSRVLTDRCYGCGRCLPICPIQHIVEQSYVSTPAQVVELLQSQAIEAIEIHTQPDHEQAFQQLWQQLQPVYTALS